MHRHTLNLDGLLDFVAGRTRHRRDNRQLSTGQRVQQRRFASIGLAGNHHLDPFTQQRTLARTGQHCRQRLLQICELPKGICLA